MNDQKIGVAGIMFLILFTLKLCGVITISWWWVTVPLWGPVVISLLVIAAIYILSIFINRKH